MRYLPFIAALVILTLSACSGMGDGEEGWEAVDIDGETEIWVPVDPTPEQVTRAIDRRPSAPRTDPVARPTPRVPPSSPYPPPPPPPTWIPEVAPRGAGALPPPPPPPPLR